MMCFSTQKRSTTAVGESGRWQEIMFQMSSQVSFPWVVSPSLAEADFDLDFTSSLAQAITSGHLSENWFTRSLNSPFSMASSSVKNRTRLRRGTMLTPRIGERMTFCSSSSCSLSVLASLGLRMRARSMHPLSLLSTLENFLRHSSGMRFQRGCVMMFLLSSAPSTWTWAFLMWYWPRHIWIETEAKATDLASLSVMSLDCFVGWSASIVICFS